MKPALLSLFGFLFAAIGFGQVAFSPAMMSQPKEYSKEFESIFFYKEVPVFVKNVKEKSILLRNGYASSVLQLPVSWPPKIKSYHVKEVRVIFTKYPVDKNFWNTNYYELLAARLQAAFAIDAKLNDVHINYSLILQTNCKTEDEAKGMLHSLEVVYELGERKIDDDDIEPTVYDTLYNQNEDSLAWLNGITKANRFIKKSKMSDTVVLKGLDIFSLQDSLLVVIDCTGSMAPYYSQVTLWAARNFFPGHYYVLFNDAGPRILPLGQTGGYVDGRVSSVDQLIKLFKKATATRGGNKETAENDIEGVLSGIQFFPDNKGVILVADNANCIRDYKLLSNVDQPVHIIPCGGGVLNPQFLNVASYTGGSVFWQDQYIKDWITLCTGDIYMIGNDPYRFNTRTQSFELLDAQGVHTNFCDSYITKLKKKKKKKKN